MGSRILVADDDEDMADVLRMSLATMGHAVVTCAKAREVIERLRSDPFDGVLLDLTMPDMSAEKLIDAIEALPARPPIVVFSARSTREARSFAARLGAALLPKPCELSELLDTISANFHDHGPLPNAADELEAR
ncbi:MAG: response regulator [Deltaproteobacteria bacterium]|nr:response regulator [Deltaproteobacteria bacterium]